ncbi:MAG: TfuA-like protein, partial [Paracoccaceae bacterium]
GIGDTYEWYREGVIADDDEVELVHGPGESGSPPMSLPMVNVRATCAAAVAQGLPTGDVIAHAKAQFYKIRTWPTVLDGADLSAETAEWLRDHEVDQKRLDAITLLDRMMTGGLPIPAPTEPFETTSQWMRATQDWSRPRHQETPQERETLLGAQAL